MTFREYSSRLLKNSNIVALSGVEAPNPERMTGFDFAHPDADSLFSAPCLGLKDQEASRLVPIGSQRICHTLAVSLIRNGKIRQKLLKIENRREFKKAVGVALLTPTACVLASSQSF